MEISPETVDFLISMGIQAVAAIAILLAGWMIAGATERVVRKRAERSRVLDATLAIMLGKVARALVLAVTLIAVLNQFGVQTTSLIALLGAAGLAVGLALQGTLSNVASGIMLLVLRPFRVGDVIEFGSTLGIVDEIGLFVTSMHRPDNIAMVVPNSQIWGNTIMNYGTNATRRIDLVFGISYSDDMEKATSIINGVIEADSRCLKDPAPLVAVAELADSSVNIYARPWVNSEDFFATKLDLTRKVKERFDAQGISIPFPQQDVHMHQVQAKAA
ncbi:MAG TPA: mechanosensitive ion channel domain-containing protein [Burkholderiales bacterium]|nr:mechanosensitive ion channel domain-containing protein [Burkholderiales bacterium]